MGLLGSSGSFHRGQKQIDLRFTGGLPGYPKHRLVYEAIGPAIGFVYIETKAVQGGPWQRALGPTPFFSYFTGFGRNIPFPFPIFNPTALLTSNGGIPLATGVVVPFLMYLYLLPAGAFIHHRISYLRHKRLGGRMVPMPGEVPRLYRKLSWGVQVQSWRRAD